MKAIEDLKAALAAATPGGLYPSVEEVRLLCGTPDFTLYSQLLEHAPALIECAERLNELLGVINADRDDGYFICEEAGPVIAGAHAATLKLVIAKLENAR